MPGVHSWICCLWTGFHWERTNSIKGFMWYRKCE